MLRRRAKFVEWMASKAPLQLFSLLIAVLAWLLVNSGQVVQQKRTIKIQYVQIPKNLVFQRSPVKEVKVELSGSSYRLRTISDDDLIYSIDLSSAKAGITKIDLDTDALRLPLDVEAAHLTPHSFNVYMEEVYVRTLPLKPLFMGKPRDGFQVGIVKLIPETISVTGPKSVLSKISEIPIEISVDNRELSFSESVKPKLSFPNAEALDSVSVEVEITTQRTRQQFPSVPVVARGGTRKVKITPAFAKVTLEAPDSELRGIESKLQVIVSSEGLKHGHYRLRGRLDVSENIKLISLEPENFLVEVLQEGTHK